MRKSLLVVVSLAVGLFASAAQAECSKVIEIPLAALSEKPETVQPALDCLAFRIQLVQAQNTELVAAKREAVDDGLTVYVLQYSPNSHVLLHKLDNATESSVAEEREHYDGASRYTGEIWPDSPFYSLAAAAYRDLVDPNRKKEDRPVSVTELIGKVVTVQNTAVATRRSTKSPKLPVVAEGK